MPHPILSICITTYNRKKYLKECLDSILVQNNASDIEVIISDNASTDGTQDFVEKYIRENKGKLNIKYFRNKKNIGGCLNITNIPLLADTEYVWIFSDDDVLEDDVHIISHIINIIKDKSPDIMFVNFNVFDEVFKKILFHNQMKINKDSFFKNGVEFVNSLKLNNYGTIGLMSCNIYRRIGYSKERAKEIYNITKNNGEVGYPHLEVFLNDLQNKTVYLDHKYCIKGRGENSCRDIGKYLQYQIHFCKIFIRQGLRVWFFRGIMINQILFYPIYKLSSFLQGTILYHPLSWLWRKTFYAIYLFLIGNNKISK